MNTTTITRNVTIAKIANSLIVKERISLSDDIKITYNNICQNNPYIPNNPMSELIKL